MDSKLLFHRCIWAIFLILLAACGQTNARPTVVVDDTALSVAFTEFAQTPVAMPTLTVGPTHTQDRFAFPTVSFFSTPFTATSGPGPTLIPTNTPQPTLTFAPTRTLVPLPFQILKGLRVAYNIGGDLYVQDSGKQVVQLTRSGHDYDPIFSEDGQKIVFYRGEGENLWGIDVNGTGEQQLISLVLLAAFGPEYDGRTELRSLIFVPGSHLLLFNTHFYRGTRDYPPKQNNDLFLVDTDTGEIKQLLAPGQGGDFLVSPDGKWIAVQIQGHIDVIDLQGQIVRHNLATYPVYNPPTKVPMVWMPNSRELIVLPSQFDPLTAGIPVLRQVWRYSLDGNSGMEIPLDPSPIDDAFSISPDGNWIAYSYHPSELDPNTKAGVYLGNLRDGTSRLIFMPPLSKATGFPEPVPLYYEDWSPDSVNFTCYYEEVYVGNIRGEITSLGLIGLRVEEIPAWIDGNRYLLEGGSVLVEVGKSKRVRVVELPSGVNQPSNFVFLEH